MSGATITCWAKTGAYRGRCRDCKKPVLYRINRKTGHSIRFNGILDPLETFVDERLQQPMEVRSIEDLHVRFCPKRQAKATASIAGEAH